MFWQAVELASFEEQLLEVMVRFGEAQIRGRVEQHALGGLEFNRVQTTAQQLDASLGSPSWRGGSPPESAELAAEGFAGSRS